MRIKRSNKLKK